MWFIFLVVLYEGWVAVMENLLCYLLTKKVTSLQGWPFTRLKRENSKLLFEFVQRALFLRLA